MAIEKICDFCLEEKGSFFRRLQSVPGGYYICSDCRHKLAKYDLPLRNDLFQQLVIAEPQMRDMIMRSWLENHTPSEAQGKYFPSGTMLVHHGEELVTAKVATITIGKALLPETASVQEITEIKKSDIKNIPTSKSGGETIEVTGMLYETNAALYFISEHFLNVHRLTNLVIDSKDTEALHVLEKTTEFIYKIKNADLFLMRHHFYHILRAARANLQNNLVYISSENTMTLTPGIYNVPRNIKSGTYWLSAVSGSGINVRDANGHVTSVSDGQIDLPEGAMLECTGEYQLRIRKHDDPVFEAPINSQNDEVKPIEDDATFEQVTQKLPVINEDEQ